MTCSIAVVQREHFFMAQMRHMHPMVETYLQDLKNDSDRKHHSQSKTIIFSAASTCPTARKTFLSSGQPGFGQRMLDQTDRRLLPALSAHGLRADGRPGYRLSEKILQIHFCAARISGRSSLPGHRCPAARRPEGRPFHGPHLGRGSGLQHRPLQRHLLSPAQDQFLFSLRQLAPEHAPRNLASGLCLHRRIEP